LASSYCAIEFSILAMDLLLFALSGVVALMVFFIKGSIPQVAQVLNDAAQDGAGGAGDED